MRGPFLYGIDRAGRTYPGLVLFVGVTAIVKTCQVVAAVIVQDWDLLWDGLPLAVTASVGMFLASRLGRAYDHLDSITWPERRLQ